MVGIFFNISRWLVFFPGLHLWAVGGTPLWLPFWGAVGGFMEAKWGQVKGKSGAWTGHQAALEGTQGH